MRRFDEKLADNIRHAFDNYHEEVDPAAWMSMQQRLKKKKKARVIPFSSARVIMAVAASLLLAIVSWQFVFTGSVLEDQYLQRPVVGRTEFAEPERYAFGAAKSEAPANRQQAVALAESVRHTESPVSKGEAGSSDPAREMPLALIPDLADEQTVAEVSVSEQITQPQEVLPDVVLPPLRPSRNADPYSAVALNGDPFHDFQPGRQKVQSWGVAAGSMMAVAGQRISDGLGVVAGVVTEWRISPRLTVATAGMLAWQQFEVANFDHHDLLPEMLPLADEMVVTGTNQYEMVALDIPVNAYYNLHESPSGRFFLGTGFSSVLYLQENFSAQSTALFIRREEDPNTGGVEVHTQTRVYSLDESFDAFSRFDFARLVNISAGYVFKREQGSYIIEPYVKVPLGGLTSRDVRLGMGGISLRYHFGSQ